MKRWGAKRGKIFEMDKLFFPVNIGDSHWTMVVAHLKEERIQYYDSMSGDGTPYLRAIQQYVRDESAKQLGEAIDTSGWALVQSQPDMPQQRNGSDCGAFACTTALFLSEGLDLLFSQDDMDLLRRRMAWALLQDRIVREDDG